MTNRVVLLTIADHADLKGYCFPSQETLAEECECTRKTVRTALQALETAGLIYRARRWKTDGHRASDGITLRLEVKLTLRGESLGVKNDAPKGNPYPASILNQSLKPKEDEMVWKVKQDDGPLLNRFNDADLWKVGERLMGVKAPKFCDSLHFPAAIVAQAKTELEAKSKKVA